MKNYLRTQITLYEEDKNYPIWRRQERRSKYAVQLASWQLRSNSPKTSVPRPSRIPCPFCSFYSSGWIHFIFMHLIKQLPKVCRVQSFLQNLKFWQFFKICNFDFVLFWLGIWCESLVWVIMGRRRGISERRHSSFSSYFQPHFCHEVSETHLHILDINTT